MLPAVGKLEAMSADECLKRLRTQHIGRIALVNHDGRPLIFPINYFFDEGLVAFRTGGGSKLDLAPGSHVAFETDGWDPDSGLGWSVIVTGVARDFTRTRGVPASRIAFWPVRPLAPGTREHLIGIQANEVTGRWFRTSAHRPST